MCAHTSIRVLANLRTGLDLRTGPPRCENSLRTGLDHKMHCMASYIGLARYIIDSLKFYMKPEFWYTNSWHTATAEI